MTMSFANLNIVAIGDEDMVNGLRLAGITTYHIISDENNNRDEIIKALNETLALADVGIIAIQEEHAAQAEDIINRVKEAKNLTPIILEVPSKHGTKYEDVTGYYKAYVREFTGFEVEI